MLFYQIIEQSKYNRLINDPVFIITVAILWFNLVGFVFLNFHNLSVIKNTSITTLRLINYISNYFYYILILVGLLVSALTKRHEL